MLEVVSHHYRCSFASCALKETTFRPEAEDLLAMRGATFGLDVVAAIGELRFRDKLTLLQIQKRLGSRCKITLKTIENLCEVFLALVKTQARENPELLEKLRAQGGIVLSIDGVQPEKGNEILYLLRDVRSGQVLVARNLLSSTTGAIEGLLREVLALGIPIVGVISDKQHAFVAAVASVLPDVPHQLCQFHYLRDLAAPLADADRELTKEIKRQTRGIGALERELAASDDDDAQLASEYCLAVRTVVRANGCYPLDPPGVKLYEKLAEVQSSVQQCLDEYSTPSLERLAMYLRPFVETLQAPALALVAAFFWMRELTSLLGDKASEDEETPAALLEPPTEKKALNAGVQEGVIPEKTEIASDKRLENLPSVVLPCTDVLPASAPALDEQTKPRPSDKLQERLFDKLAEIDTGHPCEPWAQHFCKTTIAWAPKLFTYRDSSNQQGEPILPRTNNEMETFIGRLKTSRRRITGRKNTQSFVLREGAATAILYSLPEGIDWSDFILGADRDSFRQNLEALRRREDRRKVWNIKRNMPSFLRGLEERHAARAQAVATKVA